MKGVYKRVKCSKCGRLMKRIANKYMNLGGNEPVTYEKCVWRCFWCGNMRYGREN